MGSGKGNDGIPGRGDSTANATSGRVVLERRGMEPCVGITAVVHCGWSSGVVGEARGREAAEVWGVLDHAGPWASQKEQGAAGVW